MYCDSRYFCIFHFVWIVVVIQVFCHKEKREESKGCNSPLGLESGKIKDSQISASCHQYEVDLEGDQIADARPRSARINGTGAWCCSEKFMKNVNLTINLEDVMYISGIATQGIEAVMDYFVEKFSVYTSINGSEWKAVYSDLNTNNKVWMGNTDGLGIKRNMFSPQVQARYIRISPLKYSYKMCMKLELFGCRKKNNTVKQHPPTISTAQNLVHPATITRASKRRSTHSHHFGLHLVDVTTPFITEQTIANVSSGISGVKKKGELQKNHVYFIAVTVSVVIGVVLIAVIHRQRKIKSRSATTLRTSCTSQSSIAPLHCYKDYEVVQLKTNSNKEEPVIAV